MPNMIILKNGFNNLSNEKKKKKINTIFITFQVCEYHVCYK